MKKIIRITAVLLLSVSLFSFDFNKDLEKKYNLKAEKDKKSGITWFKHNSCVKASSRIYLYFGITEKKGLVLRMVINYFDEDRLFINKYILTIEDEEHILSPREQIQFIEAEELTCEYYDVMINQDEFALLQKIAQAEEVKLRYVGAKGFKRVKIHKKAKNALEDVLNAIQEVAAHIQEQQDK